MSTNTKSGGAWRSFEEASQGMSPEKVASEKRRRDIGLILGPVLFIILLLIPLPEPLTVKANHALAIVAWVMTWWICEPIPMPATSLLGVGLFMLLQVQPAATVMNNLGNSNTWYLLSTFVFMNALVKHGFATRVAYWLLSLPIGRKSPYALLALYIVSVGIISAFLSNMATTMLFLAISTGMITALQVTEDHAMAQAMRLGSAYGAQCGGFGTPMGSAGTNFLAIGLVASLAGADFTVVDWMKVGFPFMIAMTLLLAVYFRGLFKIDLPNYQKACDYAKDELKALGPMTTGEKRAVAIAVLVVICWLIPDGCRTIFGGGSEIYALVKGIFNSATVAIIGAVLCFVVPENWKDRKFLMNWTEANRYIDWGALLLIVCGLVMGNAMGAEDVGILAFVANGVGGVLGGLPPIVGVFGLVTLATVLTQIISNVPAISIMLPVGFAVSQAIGLNPVAILLALAFACQNSYALPVAAPQMAFVYGTGSISMKQFVKAGGLFTIISIFATSLIGYYLAAAMFPM